MANRLEAALIKKNGGNQSEMARFIGVSPQAVQKWISGESEPRGKNLRLASEFLGVPEAILKYGEGHGNALPGPELRGRLPLINWVRAGDLCEPSETIHPSDAEEWIDCPVPHSKRAYCLRVSGDSMDGEGGYRDGEIIFVDPEVAATPGRDVVVRTEDGKTTFKRLKQDTEGLYLFGINGKKIIRIPLDTHICGVVIFSGFKR